MSFNNFVSMSMIPSGEDLSLAAQGSCQTNVDGQCIRGGTKQAGVSAYALASLGAPNATCASLGLFAAGNQPYTVDGWTSSSSTLTFKSSPGI